MCRGRVPRGRPGKVTTWIRVSNLRIGTPEEWGPIIERQSSLTRKLLSSKSSQAEGEFESDVLSRELVRPGDRMGSQLTLRCACGLLDAELEEFDGEAVRKVHAEGTTAIGPLASEGTKIARSADS